MKFRICLCWLWLAACSTSKEEKSGPAAGEAAAPLRLDDPALTVALPDDDPAPTRIAARRASVDDIDFLRRQLSARGSARLWAAWGLGKLCPQDRAGIAAALVSALATWALDPQPPSALELGTLARALGHCGTEDAESVLRSWLGQQAALPGLSEAAALGLGSVADCTGRLEERTVTLLLDTAERDKSARLLYPLGRLPPLGAALAARTLDVAGELVTAGAPDVRRFGVLALGSAGPSAALPLSQLALQKDFPGPDRAAAVQALGRLGAAGQRALDTTLKDLLERGLPARPDDDTWLVLTGLLQLLDQPNESRKVLAELNRAPLPEGTGGADGAQRRRLVGLRCRAADVVARATANHPALTECDPDHGPLEKEAQLRVLGRGRLVGDRAATFEKIARGSEPVVQQAALRLLPAHPEYTGALELLVHALTSPAAGTRASALQVVATHPDRAHTAAREPVPDPRVIHAIEDILGPQAAQTPLETRAAALRAAGALGTMTLKPAVERHCDGPERALRPIAQAALGLLGSPKQTCPSRAESPTAPVPPAGTAAQPVVVVRLASDVGELTLRLDSPDTPQARRDFVALIESGFYEGTRVNAVLAGLAVQWGDRNADGYEDGVRAVSGEELGPTPWSALSIGLTGFAPFAPSSQLLVTLGDAPQLTGEKLHLGRAEGPWHLLVPGDGLTRVRVE